MPQRSIFYFLFALVLLRASGSGADPLIDRLEPMSLALGETGRADARGSVSTVLNPAGLSLDRRLVFGGSYGYRDSSGASLGSVYACDSTVQLPGCFYYKYLKAESDLLLTTSRRRLHEWGASFSRTLSAQLMVGTVFRYFDYNSNFINERDQSGYSADIGLIFLPSPSLRFAAVGHNIVGDDASTHPRGIGTGVSFKSGYRLSFNADMLWNLDVEEGQTTGRYGVGGEYVVPGGYPGGGYPVRLGGVYDAAAERGYVTFGFGLLGPKVGLDLSGRKQVSGSSDDFTVQVGIWFLGSKS